MPVVKWAEKVVGKAKAGGMSLPGVNLSSSSAEGKSSQASSSKESRTK